MSKLWWKTIGKGSCHLILLHGWGLNAKVWNSIITELVSYFTLHLVDLPGFGRSCNFGAMHLEEMAWCILQSTPNRAIWLGWSLGGLVASQIALTCPECVQLLVTVASSPCFSAKKNWAGIEPRVLVNFQRQLSEDFFGTIKRFLVLQTLGTETAKQDFFILKNAMVSFPIPSFEVLNNGLNILKNIDLRKPLADLLLPHIRIYGDIDNIVPSEISSLLDSYWPKSRSIVIKKAAHVPFISHQREFSDAIITLSKSFNNRKFY